MATYFVRKNGSDANTTVQAQNAATAWLTIDKAANEVVAGDTVVVGAGVYRELVTMDTAGTSVNQITFVADVDGALGSGDPGLVIISAYANETSAATRAACVDPNELDFITWRGFVMTGGTGAVVEKVGTGDVNYEGCIWEDCVFISGHDSGDAAVRLDFNAATTPTNDGPIWRRCIFVAASIDLIWNGNETAEQDLKISVESCQFMGHTDTITAGGAGVFWNRSTTGTFGSGGVTVVNCSFHYKYYGVYVEDGTSTTYPVTVDNCHFTYGRFGVYKLTTNDSALLSDYNTFSSVKTAYTNVSTSTNDTNDTTDPGLVGGIGDMPLWRFWGWSPYKPWEPIRLQDDSYVHAVTGAGDTAVAPAFDLYNEPRPMAGRAGERTDTYYFDTSDAGPTDNDAAWTNDANAFDGDESTLADTTTAGTETTNELRGEGTNAPASGGTISDVDFRPYMGVSTGASITVRIYTDGEGESLYSFSYSNDNAWGVWLTLATPTGGWTWAKVQALEAIVWLGAGGTVGEVGAIQLRVHSTPDGDDDIGAVEGRARPEQETTTTRTGSNAIRFEGAGYHDMLIPVGTSLTTVDIYGRYDSNYTGSLPILEALNIPGVADQSDVMVAAANTWEKLTVTFTPTADGVARIRVRSQDTSATGESFFDDLAVS